MRISDWSSDCALPISLEVDLGIGEFGDDVDPVLTAEIHDGGIEVEINDFRGRFRRIVEHQGRGLGHRVAHRLLELVEEDRKRVVSGTSVSVRVAYGGRRSIKKNTNSIYDR